MRLIDADEFKQRVVKIMKCVPLLYASETRQEYFDEVLNQQPTVEINQWIPFKVEYDDDLKMDILQGSIPNEDQEILVSTSNNNVIYDVFIKDGYECYLDSGFEFVEEAVAWMELPKPYKGE